jgi:hypothetical protein
MSLGIGAIWGVERGRRGLQVGEVEEGERVVLGGVDVEVDVEVEGEVSLTREMLNEEVEMSMSMSVSRLCSTSLLQP